MNKFTKLILTTAVFATSGFATTIAELQNGGKVESGATIDFQGQTLTLAGNASLDVFGDLIGTGTIKCGTGKVKVYGNAYKEDAANKDAILAAARLTGLTVHTLDESNKGSIAETITVEPSSALIKTNADLASYAAGIDENHLVYVANSDGSDTKCVGKTDSALEIKASLANADASISGLAPSALVVENKLKLSGDNSGFTGKAVTIGTTETPAEVEYASAKSAFQADTTVENDSKLVISDANDINLSKNLVINGTKKVLKADKSIELENSHGTLNVKGKLVLESGAKLTLGKAYEEVNAEHTYDYPQVMTWPTGTFDTAMITSDGTDGWTSGTIHDSVFSYTQDSDGNYVRTCQWQTFQAGVDKADINLTTTDNSTWLVIPLVGKRDGQFFCYKGDKQSIITGILSVENNILNTNKLYCNTYKSWLIKEGNSTVGYWMEKFSGSGDDNYQALHEALQAGNKLMTLAEYNAQYSTSYTWA